MSREQRILTFRPALNFSISEFTEPWSSLCRGRSLFSCTLWRGVCESSDAEPRDTGAPVVRRASLGWSCDEERLLLDATIAPQRLQERT